MKRRNQWQGKVLVVDDEERLCQEIVECLEETGYLGVPAYNAAEARQRFQEEPFPVVILDIVLPETEAERKGGWTPDPDRDTRGLKVLQYIREQREDTRVIMLTAHAKLEFAIEALRSGAFDFVTKGPNMWQEIVPRVERAFEHLGQFRRLLYLEQKVQRARGFAEMVGTSEPMQRLYETLAKVAATEATVLIRGETGTGKELVARALVERSPRAKAPFIKVDCNIPENLAEIEFFGVVANYPGFHREEPKTGLFELANGGTLFLDEIGDLALSVQPKLNRALEEGEIRRVGGEQVIPVDVRVIAATNRDLEQAIREGKFRADLFYRLNVVNVEVPPLRDRKEDIPLLVAHFVKMYARKLRRPPPDIAPEGLELLQRYHYPGNVRELENIMERAVILTEGDTILPDVLPVEVVEGPSTSNLVPSEHKFADTKNDFEKNYVETLLRETRGNVTRAAEKAGIDRKNFREKIKKHGLNAADYRKAS